MTSSGVNQNKQNKKIKKLVYESWPNLSAVLMLNQYKNGNDIQARALYK